MQNSKHKNNLAVKPRVVVNEKKSLWENQLNF